MFSICVLGVPSCFRTGTECFRCTRCACMFPYTGCFMCIGFAWVCLCVSIRGLGVSGVMGVSVFCLVF